MRQRENHSWFNAVNISLIVLVMTALAVTGLVLYQRHKPSSANKAETVNTSPSANAKAISNISAQPAIANWPVYSNAKYGFSFSYPSAWQVELGDLASSVDDQHTELVLWLVDPSVPTTQNKTVYIEVSSRDLASKTAIIDNSIDSEGGKSANYKQSLALQGRETVKYTIPQSKTVNREMYFFSVGTRTYSVQTIHEDTNIARNPDYVSQFNALVNSWRLP